jgi:hypothetical protein
MWIVVGVFIALIWLFFLLRARPLARTLDRGEVMVLKPLSMTYLLLAVAFAFSSAWLVAAVCVIAWLLNGAIGASLHRGRSFTELSEGTLEYMQKGPRAPLSEDEPRRLASVLLGASTILGGVLVVTLVWYSLRWYFALAVAFVAAWVFWVGSMFLVAYKAYKKGPSPPGAAAR